jgi:uncharacterized membrane protein
MPVMTLYQVLFIAHVLGVVIWLGGSLTMFLLWRRALVSKDDEAIKAQSETSLWIERRLAIPAAIVVLVAGGWLMTEGNWGMDQGWLHIGMGAVFGAAGISLLWTGRFQRRLVTGGGSAALTARITAGMLTSMGVTLVAFWAMIAKPWS